MSKKHPSEAKASRLFSDVCGTTEVMPRHKTLPEQSFSAACLAPTKGAVKYAGLQPLR
jgi:hypothetical protein